MTKKEIKSSINKAVYIYAGSLGYQMSDDNDGSCVTFYKPDDFYHPSSDNTIDYSRSQHETYVANWASDETKADAELIDNYAKHMVKKYEAN